MAAYGSVAPFLPALRWPCCATRAVYFSFLGHRGVGVECGMWAVGVILASQSTVHICIIIITVHTGRTFRRAVA